MRQRGHHSCLLHRLGVAVAGRAAQMHLPRRRRLPTIRSGLRTSLVKVMQLASLPSRDAACRLSPSLLLHAATLAAMLSTRPPHLPQASLPFIAPLVCGHIQRPFKPCFPLAARPCLYLLCSGPKLDTAKPSWAERAVSRIRDLRRVVYITPVCAPQAKFGRVPFPMPLSPLSKSSARQRLTHKSAL